MRPTRAELVTAGATAHEPPASLQPAVLQSMKWKATALVVREGTRLAVGIMLARLLTPDQWGIAGMAIAVAAVFQLVSDPVVGYALVQKDTITESDRSAAFWITLGMGLLLTVVGIACSGALAAFFGEPSVQGLFVALSVGFTLSSLGTVPGALLARALAFRSLELRHIVATLCGATIAVAVALGGGGPWAIIANSLGTTVASTVLLWIFVPWRPQLRFSRESARGILGFGIPMYGSQLLTYFQLTADKVLVGRYLGSTALGNYAFSYNLMFTPVLNIAFPLQEVLFAALATIQRDRERLTSAWLRGKRIAYAAMAPAFLALLVVAPDLIPAVFGPNWDDAIPVLQLLCVAGVALSLGAFNGVLLIVLGRVRRLLLLNIVSAVATLLSVAVGLNWDIVTVAAAYAIAQWAIVLPETWLTTRAGGVGLMTTLRTTATSLPFALVAALAGFATRWWLVEAGMPAGLRAALVLVVIVATYLGLLWLAAPSLRVELDAVLARLRGRRADLA